MHKWNQMKETQFSAKQKTIFLSLGICKRKWRTESKNWNLIWIGNAYKEETIQKEFIFNSKNVNFYVL